MCKQLERKTAPKQNLTYKNTEDLSGVTIGADNNPDFVKTDIPKGDYRNWTFYWNHHYCKDGKDMNIKLGDCVYVKQVKGNNWDMIRVQYLIDDEERKTWFCGYLLFSEHQIPKISKVGINNTHKVNYPNQKFTIPGNGWAPLNSIVGTCCCLFLKDYRSGRPLGFKKQDTYPIIYNFNWDKTLSTKQKERAVTQIGVPDYGACKKKLVWRDHTDEEKANLATQDRVVEVSRGDASDDDNVRKRKTPAKKSRPSSAKKPRVSKSKTPQVVKTEEDELVDEDEPIASTSYTKPLNSKPGPKSKTSKPGPKSKTQTQSPQKAKTGSPAGPKSKKKTASPQLNGYTNGLFENEELYAPKIGVEDPDHCNFESADDDAVQCRKPANSSDLFDRVFK
jgi:hypothetical protein